VARKRLLPIGILAALIAVSIFPTLPAFAGQSSCTVIEIANKTCNVSGSLDGGGVTLSGNKNLPGSDGNANGNGKTGGKNGAPPPLCPPGSLPSVCEKFTVLAPGAPGNPAVSIRDLKNFPAVPGTDHMEPNGWMVTGLSTNFYSLGGIRLESDVLLGQPASVRFTPVSWHWTYGDGTSATRSTAGTTWAAQGIPEFDPTPTSHTYTADGTYFIDLSITFTADYRYAGGGWIPVLGTVTLPANRLEATAGDAKTVLVNRDCQQNPGGPGC
jgi:hypothetical protein